MSKQKNESLENFIKKSAIKDVADYSLIALPVISLFEAVMIIDWCIFFDHSWTLDSVGHLLAYAALFAASVVCFFLMQSKRRNCDKNYRFMVGLQYFYAILIFAWALAVTVLDAVCRGSFSILIYATIITIVPMFCYLNSIVWGVMEFASAAIIIWLAVLYEEHTLGFITNFLVFTVISILAQVILFRTRRMMYTRQFELIKAREKEYNQARIDNLTGLQNRRSYDEKIDELEKEAFPENLLVVSMDVNGLKNTNDTRGHRAGDELIKGMADAAEKTFSPYGNVYRIGGDEFMAILTVDKEKIDEIKEKFNQNMREWKGEYSKTLSASAGFSFYEDHEGQPFAELEKAADAEMYEHKRRYHASQI